MGLSTLLHSLIWRDGVTAPICARAYWFAPVSRFWAAWVWVFGPEHCRDEFEKMEGPASMMQRLKMWGETIVVLAIILGAVWAWWGQGLLVFVRDHLDQAVESRGGGVCASIPEFGHSIVDGAPGTWGSVVWRDVVRLRSNCGTPVVTGTITNGGGYYHDAPLSISGVVLPEGRHNLPYLFFINEEVRPGAARFRVTVTYPDAVGGAPPAISPWVNFTVLGREK